MAPPGNTAQPAGSAAPTSVARRARRRVAVVTGAGSGIGEALALQLAARGHRLAVSDVDERRTERTRQLCERAGAPVLASTVDVGDAAAMAEHAEEVVAAFGTVNIVFNNAGVAYAGNASAQARTDIQRLIQTNLWGVIHGTQAFLPHLIASGNGHVVNISSVFGMLGVPSHTAYCASKFGVRGYTEALAAELIANRQPVRASCVHPGGVRTRIAQDAVYGAEHDADGLAEFFSRIARTTPEDAARTILRGVARGRSRILVGADARALDLVSRLLGGASPRAVAAVTRRLAGPQLLARGAGSSPVSASNGTPAAAKTAAPIASRSSRS